MLTLKKTSFQDILINSLGSFIAGIIGSILILIITFLISDFINIKATFDKNNLTQQIGTLFPIILSLITFLGTSITIFLTYFLLNLTNPEKYKKNFVIFGQLAFFCFFVYIFLTPIYIYIGAIASENIMIVFLVHVFILIFGTNIILEILNNYRYMLTGLYGSFVGLFFSTIFTFFIFTYLSSSSAKLISLLALLPLINFLITLFKQIFERIYFEYNRYTNLDPLGDIFYQIELDEKENEKLEELKN